MYKSFGALSKYKKGKSVSNIDGRNITLRSIQAQFVNFLELGLQPSEKMEEQNFAY